MRMKALHVLTYSTLFLLLLACVKEEKPEACFSVDKSTAMVGEVITFTNCSSEATKYEWDFGDGDSENIANPTHSYNQPGTYTVRLNAIARDSKTNNISTTVITIQ